MTRAARIRGRISALAGARDRGVSFIELLVAIVLLGIAVIAIIAAVRATVIAARIDTDQAKAQAWLSAAADDVDEAARVPCALPVGAPSAADDPSDWIDNRGSAGVNTPGTVWTEYQSIVATTPAPGGWAGATISVSSIEFLGRSTPDSTTFDWSPDYCYEGVQDIGGSIADFRQSSLPSQRVTIEVRDIDGALLESVDVVKGVL